MGFGVLLKTRIIAALSWRYHWSPSKNKAAKLRSGAFSFISLHRPVETATACKWLSILFSNCEERVLEVRSYKETSHSYVCMTKQNSSWDRYSLCNKILMINILYVAWLSLTQSFNKRPFPFCYEIEFFYIYFIYPVFVSTFVPFW